jgi:hypothetical protein
MNHFNSAVVLYRSDNLLEKEVGLFFRQNGFFLRFNKIAKVSAVAKLEQ